GMSVFGYDGNTLVRRIDNPKIENLVETLRTKFGSKTIDKKASARLMFKVLRDGERLGIVADQNAQPHEAVFVNFFDVPASTTNGVAKLALRTNSIVLPTFAIWQPRKKRYLLKIEPPVNCEKSGDDEKDVLELTQNFTTSIEQIIREFPEQWLWIHKRWNTRPNDEANFYEAVSLHNDFANGSDAAILRENLRK
ncbi:MAG: lysophospholipid acyltransferase family protein, partial [Pyrinomonadaceae bacterium]|nr:lysophospholipid acyltransferase family protein [Pyrinomonadaceae bacterium]